VLLASVGSARRAVASDWVSGFCDKFRGQGGYSEFLNGEGDFWRMRERLARTGEGFLGGDRGCRSCTGWTLELLGGRLGGLKRSDLRSVCVMT